MQVDFLFVLLHFDHLIFSPWMVFLKVCIRVIFDKSKLIEFIQKLLVSVHAQVFSEFGIRDNLLQNDLLVHGFISLVKVYLGFEIWVTCRVQDLFFDGGQFDELSEKNALELLLIDNFVD